jgi:hypothetical protein
MTTQAEQLALLEARVGAQFSLLMAAYKVMLRKGLITEAELEVTFNSIATGLQRAVLESDDLPPEKRLDIDAHLAEIGRLRHHLEV